MNCKKYKVKDKYEILVDPRHTIISCEPPSEALLYKNFLDIFTEYKSLVKFDLLGEVEYPMIVEEEIVEEFKKKNPAIGYLEENFNLIV